ncbi:MAG: hypothetical protein Q8M40_06925 [Legionella sp.]|nr:hypothetical protein [Legionella sp.]
MRRPGLLQFNTIKSLFLYLIVITLSGCVDLSGSRSTYTAINHVSSANKKVPIKKGQVHTMRGGLGIFSIGMNQLRDKVSERYQMQAYSTMWYNAGDVTRFIVTNYYKEKVHTPIILVGHSLGANEQIKVARNLNALGIPVALLVTVDAVSQTIIPPNVHYALNVYKPGYVPMFSGLKLRAVNPDKTIINNINVNSLKEVQVNHFTIDKDKVVQAIILDKVDKVLIDGKQKYA